MPGLELGVGALAGRAQLGVGLVGVLLGGGLVPAAVGGEQRLAGAVVALVRQDDQPGGGQLADDAPDPGGLRSWVLPRSAPETHTMSPPGEAMTCRFMPCFLCLPGVERPVRGDPVDRDQGAVQDHERQLAAFFAARSAARSFGARADSSSDRLVDIPPGRGGADARTRRPGPRTSRPCAGRPAPAGPAGPGSACATTTRSPGGGGGSPRRRSSGSGGTTAARHGRKAWRPLGDGRADLGRSPHLPGASLCRQPPRRP